MNYLFGSGMTPLVKVLVETLIVGVCIAIGLYMKKLGLKTSIVGLVATSLSVALILLSIVDDFVYWANISFNSPLTMFLIYNLAIVGFIFSLFGVVYEPGKAIPITTLAVSFLVIVMPVILILLMMNIP